MKAHISAWLLAMILIEFVLMPVEPIMVIQCRQIPQSAQLVLQAASWVVMEPILKILYIWAGKSLLTRPAPVFAQLLPIRLEIPLTNKVYIGTSYGAAILPGLRVNDSSLVYLRFGYSCANIEAQESARVAGLTANSDSNNWQRGYAYGLGIETAIYKAFSLRTEYTHTEYNTFSSSFDTAYNSPYDNQFMLALIYHWG